MLTVSRTSNVLVGNRIVGKSDSETKGETKKSLNKLTMKKGGKYQLSQR